MERCPADLSHDLAVYGHGFAVVRQLSAERIQLFCLESVRVVLEGRLSMEWMKKRL
jgi:hypothetical protein